MKFKFAINILIIVGAIILSINYRAKQLMI